MSATAPSPEEQLRRFFAGTIDFAIVLASPEGVIQGWLGAAEHVLGYRAGQALGQPLSILFTAEDVRRGLDLQEIAVARAHGRSEDDRWHVREDGSRFWASGVLMAIRDADGRVVGLCKLLRDKTDLRSQILSLENKVAARDDELESLRRYITSTVHELRNPLMPISSALALLRRPDARQFAERALTILDNQLTVLKALLDDLGNGQQAAQPPVEMHFQAVDFGAAVRAATDGLQDAARKCRLDFSVVIAPAPLWVRADPARLQQMLLNLLSNAFKYTPAGGRVSVSVSAEAEMAVARIEDNGSGISAEALPHVFELFTREGRMTQTPGLGVGLAVVKELTALHGGSIDARSAGRDKGSIFGLRLPLLRGPGEAGVWHNNRSG